MPEDEGGCEVGYERWCERVLEMMSAAGRVRNRKLGETAAEFLERCRGDEPYDAWDDDETAEEYVADLSTPDPRDGDTGVLDPEDEL